jgi:hypothetical protein
LIPAIALLQDFDFGILVKASGYGITGAGTAADIDYGTVYFTARRCGGISQAEEQNKG